MTRYEARNARMARESGKDFVAYYGKAGGRLSHCGACTHAELQKHLASWKQRHPDGLVITSNGVVTQLDIAADRVVEYRPVS